MNYEINDLNVLKSYNLSILGRLNALCEPLKIFNITDFGYSKIIENEKLFRFSTHNRWTEVYFDNKLFNNVECYRNLLSPTVFDENKKEIIFIWTGEPSDSVSKIKLASGLWNGISIYEIKENYIEVWAFGSTIENSQLGSFYIKNLEFLKRFIVYFRNLAPDILDISQPDKLIKIEVEKNKNPTPLLSTEQVDDFIKKTSVSKFILSKNEKKFYLTQRELECLFHKSKGLRAKEVARILKISPRTVEWYLGNCKMKSEMADISSLMSLCKEAHLF